MAAGLKQISSSLFFSFKESNFLLNHSPLLFIMYSSTISKDKTPTKKKRKASEKKIPLSTTCVPSEISLPIPTVISTVENTKRTKKSVTLSPPLSTSDSLPSTSFEATVSLVSPKKKKRTKKEVISSTLSTSSDPPSNSLKKKRTKKDIVSSLSDLSSTETTSTKSKRTKATTVPSTDTTTIDRPPPTKFPFYGQDPITKDPITSDDKNTIIHDGEDNDNNKDVFIGKRDTPDGRYYHYQSTNYGTTTTPPYKETYKFPSVTTILDQTRPRSSWFSLRNWRLSMIEEMGEDGFKKWKQNVINVGKNFHSYLEYKLKDKTKTKVTKSSSTSPHFKRSSISHSALPSSLSFPPSLPQSSSPSPSSHLSPHDNSIPIYQEYASITDLLHTLNDCYNTLSPSLPSSLLSHSFDSKSLDNYRYMESIKEVLNDVSDVLVTEGMVMHKELGYSGTFDCVAKYKDSICLIDWKTSFKPKPTLETLYDYPLQTVAYAGAINNSNKYPFKVDNILIVVAYSTGFPAHAHFLDSTQCHTYWEAWLDRLDQYHSQFAYDLSTVL